MQGQKRTENLPIIGYGKNQFSPENFSYILFDRHGTISSIRYNQKQISLQESKYLWIYARHKICLMANVFFYFIFY